MESGNLLSHLIALRQLFHEGTYRSGTMLWSVVVRYPRVLDQFRAQADFPILASQQLDNGSVVCTLRDNGNAGIQDLQLHQELFYEE